MTNLSAREQSSQVLTIRSLVLRNEKNVICLASKERQG